ncbi:MAG: TonB-dependent receptor domain-containing protein, partial [bacterium]
MLQISRLQENRFGQLNFSPEATRDPQNPSRTGDALASALLGLPSRIQAFVPEFGSIDFKTSTLSAYVQDQWALKPNLTLTYGLRYDYITKATGRGLQSGPDLSTGEWLIALPEIPPVCTGQAPPCLPAPLDQIPSNQYIRATGEEFSILQPIKDNFGPRVGVAWQFNPSTVMRTGYSLMWDSMVSRSQYGQHQFETWGWPQFSGIDTQTINVEGGPVTPIESIGTLPFGLPAAQPWNASGWFNDPNRKNAYSHQWHVEMQRELSRNLMVAVGYVGSYNGRMEYSGYAHVPAEPAIDAATGRRLTPAERNQLRPWPHITGTFRYEDDIGMSRYNALQLKVQNRFSEGLASILSYTLSKSVDTSSGWFAVENG